MFGLVIKDATEEKTEKVKKKVVQAQGETIRSIGFGGIDTKNCLLLPPKSPQVNTGKLLVFRVVLLLVPFLLLP